MKKKSMVESVLPDYVYAKLHNEEKDEFIQKEVIFKDYIQITIITFIVMILFTIGFIVWKVSVFKFLSLSFVFFFLLGLVGVNLSFRSIVKEAERILRKYG